MNKTVRRRFEDRAREECWMRDRSRDRATGRLLEHGHPDPDRRGEVHHLKTKGAHPELRFELSNLVLLSYTNHCLSDGRGGRRLQILGENANEELEFVMHDPKGKELWRHVSRP